MLFSDTKVRIIAKKTRETIVFFILFIIFAAVNDISIIICTDSEELPEFQASDFFHSSELFRIYKDTPRHRPVMVVARCAEGRVAAHLLAVIRRRSWLVPPFLLWHCRIVGEGDYTGFEEHRDELFNLMMTELVKWMPVHVEYIELSNFTSKMFGYKTLSGLGFFAVNWLNIHNSLHSKSPEERISAKLLGRINGAIAKGVETHEVRTEKEFADFVHLLKAHNYFKPKRFIPDATFFRKVVESGCGKLLITTYNDTTIGCCAYAVSKGNAYLWYAAYLRKSYLRLYPAEVTVWNAIKTAYEDGCQHFCFLDVGLPYRANKLRDFILGYGGKPVSAFRWFRCRYKWLNRILTHVWSF